MTGTLALVRPRRDCACPRARHQHGTVQAYVSDACRCTPCTHAHAAAARHRRRMRAYGRHEPMSVPLVGSGRRIRALMVNGWTMRGLARQLGMPQDRLHIILAKQTGISPRYARAITALYDRLWDQAPPMQTWGDRVSAGRARSHAARNGWAAPLDWDDDEIDDPNAVPHTPVGCSSWDLQPCGTDAAARRHHRAGEPLDEACRRASNRIATERRARRAAQVRADLDALTA